MTRISEMIDKKYLFISPRIGKALAVKETVQSDVLLYPGWKGYKGVIGVKPLDYLASRNNILLAPGDDDILDNLLTKTHSGVIANSAEEFLNELNKFYSQWKKNKICIYNGVESEIRFFSRENQAKIFAQNLQTLRGNDIKN